MQRVKSFKRGSKRGGVNGLPFVLSRLAHLFGQTEQDKRHQRKAQRTLRLLCKTCSTPLSLMRP